jgi:SAM-dependent methyltransferase
MAGDDVSAKAGDAFGAFLLAHHEPRDPSAELIERDDSYIDFGSRPGLYFTGYDSWSPAERGLMELAREPVLDIGCGAGRHSLHLQNEGLDVVAIDSSAGAIEVCRRRGLKHARVLSVTEVGRLGRGRFNTILMLGNNFGLLGSPRRARKILRDLHSITRGGAAILAQTRNPYRTTDPDHLAYHQRNRARGRMAGQIRMRVRYGKIVGPWFDYLFVSPSEMNEIVAGTGWTVERLIDPDAANYHAIIRRA